LTNTRQRSPLSVKAIVVQIEMSLTLLTKASKGKGPTTTDNTEDSTLPPIPIHKSGRYKRQLVDRLVVVLTIPSSSIAINKDPPIILTVKGTND
jgi:hypothetical protein